MQLTANARSQGNISVPPNKAHTDTARAVSRLVTLGDCLPLAASLFAASGIQRMLLSDAPLNTGSLCTPGLVKIDDPFLIRSRYWKFIASERFCHKRAQEKSGLLARFPSL